MNGANADPAWLHACAKPEKFNNVYNIDIMVQLIIIRNSSETNMRWYYLSQNIKCVIILLMTKSQE